tara:strand:+ start:670 stop:1098 length:429 start_codon:yes stop_codon:yes gene_type:complete
MTKKIRLDQIGNFAEEAFNEMLEAVILVADQKIKEGTPVDSGRLRANWQVAENSEAGTRTLLPGKYSNIPPINKVNYVKEKIGKNYFILNNLPYAEPNVLGTNLPKSWGGQFRSRENKVSKGWFQQTAKEVADFAKSFKYKG